MFFKEIVIAMSFVAETSEFALTFFNNNIGRFTKEPFMSIMKTLLKLEPSVYSKLKLIVLISPGLVLKAANYFHLKCLYFDNMTSFFDIFKTQEELTKKFVSILPIELS